MPDLNLLEWFGAVFLVGIGLGVALVATYCAEQLWNDWQDAREARRAFNETDVDAAAWQLAEDARREWERHKADDALRKHKERGL